MNGAQGILFFSLVISLISMTECIYNLASKKPTWQMPSISIYPSERAVDNQKSDCSAAGNQCAISDGTSHSATWMVDLQPIQVINNIMIYYRTERTTWKYSVYASRFLGFSLYVSNTTNKKEGILCFHDTQYNSGSIPSVMNISCPVSGRYVIYYNTREGNLSHTPTYSPEAYIELCEVEVYGCPALGFKGQYCDEPCPDNCQHCHLYTGECLGACNPGYYGDQCKIYDRKNLAFNKPTYQSSTYWPATRSGNAVDGLKRDSSIYSGQCSYTAFLQPYALWRVDLMQQRKIERINLYPMTSNLHWTEHNPNTEKLLGFSLIVSNTTDRNKGVVCYKDTHHKKYLHCSI